MGWASPRGLLVRRLGRPRTVDAAMFVALVLFGLLAGVLQANGQIPRGQDAWAYWSAQSEHLYPELWLQAGKDGASGYVYPPPLAQALAPVHFLGWQLFQVVWTTLLFAALWILARRWSVLVIGVGVAAALVPGSPPLLTSVLGYAMNGNVQILIGASVVLSFRWPGAWALPLLTKITPGIGLLWAVVRREWSVVAAALATTVAMVVVSYVVAPGAWADFAAFLGRNDLGGSPIPLVPVPLPIRLAMSALLIVWAAPRDARWALPLAVGWAIPALYVDSYWPIWLGAVGLWSSSRWPRRATVGADGTVRGSDAASAPEATPSAI